MLCGRIGRHSARKRLKHLLSPKPFIYGKDPPPDAEVTGHLWVKEMLASWMPRLSCKGYRQFQLTDSAAREILSQYWSPARPRFWVPSQTHLREILVRLSFNNRLQVNGRKMREYFSIYEQGGFPTAARGGMLRSRTRGRACLPPSILSGLMMVCRGSNSRSLRQLLYIATSTYNTERMPGYYIAMHLFEPHQGYEICTFPPTSRKSLLHASTQTQCSSLKELTQQYGLTLLRCSSSETSTSISTSIRFDVGGGRDRHERGERPGGIRAGLTRSRVAQRHRRRVLQFFHREGGADVREIDLLDQALVDAVIGGDVRHHHRSR